MRSGLQMLSTLTESMDEAAAQNLPESPQLWQGLAALHLAGIQTHQIGRQEGEEEGLFTRSNDWVSSLLNEHKAATGDVLVTLCNNCGWSTEKLAKYRCDDCSGSAGLLCEECDKILHFSRTMHCHKRSVIDNSVQLEFRGGMARVKLPCITATVDILKHKAVVEATVVSAGLGGTLCRWCSSPLTTSNTAEHQGLPAFDGLVCHNAACLEVCHSACVKVHQCGHPCMGVRDETECPPCMVCGQDAQGNPSLLNARADDYCSFCFEPLSDEPCLVLECQHVYHRPRSHLCLAC